jgi:hypothetical protein
MQVCISVCTFKAHEIASNLYIFFACLQFLRELAKLSATAEWTLAYPRQPLGREGKKEGASTVNGSVAGGRLEILSGLSREGNKTYR